jgi:hypothetical protein
MAGFNRRPSSPDNPAEPAGDLPAPSGYGDDVTSSAARRAANSSFSRWTLTKPHRYADKEALAAFRGVWLLLGRGPMISR